MRRRGAHEPVALVAPVLLEERDLRVLGERVRQLAVALLDRPPQGDLVDQVGAGEPVHARDQVAEVPGDHEVLAVLLERLDRSRRARLHPRQGEPDVLAGEVGVLLRPRQRELLLDDLLREHEPGVVVAGAQDRAQRAEGVEAGQVRRREALARRGQPQRRRPGQDPDAVVLPDRGPVAQALGVVPHPVGVDDLAAGRLGDLLHPAVDVGRHAGQHPLRRRSEAVDRPLPAHLRVVAADPARGHDHGLRVVRELGDLVAVGRPAAVGAVGGQHRAADTGHHAVGHDEVVHPVPEPERDQPALGRLAHPALERRDHPGAGAPGEVEPRHRVAVPARPAVAALGPADHGEDPHPLVVQPLPLLAGREVDVRLGPLSRPVVGLAVELGAAHPVLERQLVGVADAEAALLRRVHEEQPAQRPERLPAQGLLALLVEQEHRLARVGQLRRGDQSGQARSDHDHVCVHAWILPQIRMLRPGQTRPPVVEPDSRCER